MEKAIASLAGAQDADVKVDITIPQVTFALSMSACSVYSKGCMPILQAMLLSDWQRKMKGNVTLLHIQA